MATLEFVTSADGTQMAAEWSGHGGDTLVYVHGAGGDRAANAALKSALEKRFRILSYDRRGRGDSGDAEPYAFEKEVDDLRAVIMRAGERVMVLGISMGARIALELLRDPPKLTDMVLFEPPATGAADAEYADKIARIEALIASGDRDGALVLHNRLLHGRSDDDIAAMRAKADDWQVRRANIHVTVREMRTIHCDVLFDNQHYAQPDFPVHLLVGDQTLSFIRQSADLIETLPFVSRKDLVGFGHSAPRDHPEEIAAIVLSLATGNH